MGTSRTWVLVVLIGALLIGTAFVYRGMHPSVEPMSDEAMLLSEIQALSLQDGVLTDIFRSAEILRAQLTKRFPNSPEVWVADRILENFNVRLIFSSVLTPDSEFYEVKPGDTLTTIARHYNTTVELIMRSNGLTSDRIRAGQSLKVTKGDFKVSIKKSDNLLWLHQGTRLVKTYTVSTGRQDAITPVGVFAVTDKLIDPVWYKAGAIVPPDSPENILGSRWMGIGIPGYGIHGTTEPETLGQDITNGCVRMSNADVKELYAILPSGAEVVIVD